MITNYSIFQRPYGGLLHTHCWRINGWLDALLLIDVRASNAPRTPSDIMTDVQLTLLLRHFLPTVDGCQKTPSTVSDRFRTWLFDGFANNPSWLYAGPMLAVGLGREGDC